MKSSSGCYVLAREFFLPAQSFLHQLNFPYKISFSPFYLELWFFPLRNNTCCLVTNHDSWSQREWCGSVPWDITQCGWWGLFLSGWALLKYFPGCFMSKFSCSIFQDKSQDSISFITCICPIVHGIVANESVMLLAATASFGWCMLRFFFFFKYCLV